MSGMSILLITGGTNQTLADEKKPIFYVSFNESTQPETGVSPIFQTGLVRVEGIVGTAVRLDKGAILSYSLPDSFTPESGTIEFWIYWPEDRKNITGNLFSIGEMGKPNSFLAWNDGDITFGVYDSEAKLHRVYIPATGWVPGKWYHLCFSWDRINNPGQNAELSIYINGAPVASKQEKITVGAIVKEIKIGTEGMVIDEIKIHNYAKEGTSLWTEVRPLIPKEKDFTSSNSDKIISQKEITSPFVDMGSYVVSSIWSFTISCRGYQLIDGIGWIGLGKDEEGKTLNSHIFRKKLLMTEFEDGHKEIRWSDSIKEIGFEQQSTLYLSKSSIKYILRYSFSKERTGNLLMFPRLNGILGGKYRAVDIYGTVTEGTLPEKLGVYTGVIPKNPIRTISINTENLGKITISISTEDYIPDPSANRINIMKDSVRLNFVQNSGNTAGYTNTATIEIILE